jgi:HAMP domain-containing protein
VETVAELMVLAMAMFLAAFFCLRALFIPQNANRAIDKIYEVEETISEGRPSTR